MGEFFAALVVLSVCSLVGRARERRRSRLERMMIAVRECAAKEERRRCWDDIS